MERKFSYLKFNAILLFYIWSVYTLYGLLSSFEAEGMAFFILMILSVLSIPVLLYIVYKPFSTESIVGQNFVICGKKYFTNDEIIKAFEVNALEKFFFIAKNPRLDYSTVFFKKGILIKTLYDSYLIDGCKGSFLESKIVRRINDTRRGVFLFYLLLLFPCYGLAVHYLTGAGHLIFVLAIVIFVVLILFRFLPSFYLGRGINLDELPISREEYGQFKNITIIEGFALSDKIMTVPFKKPTYLDGLAIDMLFKRYIILNPRLFVLNSRDYLRFVLFHELCHIKHHDSAGSFAIPMVIMLSGFVIYLIPGGMEFMMAHFPYLDYIAAGVILLYLITSLVRRKGMENRADKYGIKSIGKEGVERVYSHLGYRLTEKD